MVHKETFPRKEMIDGEADNAIIRRQHIGSERRTDVFPIMRIARLPIHDSDTAKDPGSFAAHRLHKTRLP